MPNKYLTQLVMHARHPVSGFTEHAFLAKFHFISLYVYLSGLYISVCSWRSYASLFVMLL